MKIVSRAIFIVMIILYLIPSVFIELLGIREFINFVFLSFCGLFITYGIFKIKRPLGFSKFEKTLAAFGILFTAIVGAMNILIGNFYPEGYKFSVIFMLIFFGQELSRTLSVSKAVSDLVFILSAYIALLLLFFLVTGSEDLLRPTGPGGAYSRLDVTGSVTAMSVTATISILLSVRTLIESTSRTYQTFLIFVILSATYLLQLAASRQTLLIIFVYTTIHFLSGKWLSRKALFRRLALIGAAFTSVILFLLFSFYVNNSFYVRIFENPSEDYSSGRLNSIALWLEEMQMNGGPLGFGYIKNNAIQEIELLWPHNEFVRFYLEGGIFGIALIMLMFAYAVVALRISLRPFTPNSIKNLTITIFSVIFVQLSVENLLNNIFFATLCFMLLSLATHDTLKVQQTIRIHQNSTRNIHNGYTSSLETNNPT